MMLDVASGMDLWIREAPLDKCRFGWHPSKVGDISFAPNSQKVAVIYYCGVMMLNTFSGARLWKKGYRKSGGLSIAFNPNGETIAAMFDYRVFVLNAASGDEI